MAKARFTASAETDLLDLWLFIAEDNPLAADDVVDSIYRSAQLLAEQPLIGRARPELAKACAVSQRRRPISCFTSPMTQAESLSRAYYTMRETSRRLTFGLRQRNKPQANATPN
jgi:plasmid stabilization system protein ParE